MVDPPNDSLADLQLLWKVCLHRALPGEDATPSAPTGHLKFRFALRGFVAVLSYLSLLLPNHLYSCSQELLALGSWGSSRLQGQSVK